MSYRTSPLLRCASTAFAALALAALSGCASVTSPVPARPAAVVAPPAAAPPAAMPATPATAATASSAVNGTAPEQGFAQWVTAFRATARAQGVSDATLHAAFDNAQYLPRVVELDRAQPEFTRTVWQYLDGAVTAQRIAQGQEKLQALRGELDAAAARYGVPPAIVVAIWGMESNYGSNYGSTPVIDALATLGFDGRREAWARAELLAALKILDKGDIDVGHMIGSWAGAMGQTQFMPSAFIAYAVDADGDGRRDIWDSMADVTASTANFLARSGWQRGQPWGREVQLPDDFDFGHADPSVRQSTALWAAEGVRGMVGVPLPEFSDGSILMPAGARGPAFLVGPNFRAILRYNNSTSYALAVGMLAQQLDGGLGVQKRWPRDLQPLSRAQLQSLQTKLNARGFASGTPDGVMGPATRDGLRKYQSSVGLPADGYPTVEIFQSLE